MKKLLGALLWLWQLPQNLAGLMLTKLSVKGYYLTKKDQYGKEVRILCTPLFGSGVSLGEYIIIDEYRTERAILGVTDYASFMRTVHHECGHRQQSRILGFLYLPLIGVPSVIGNLYSRMTHKGSAWYFSQPWEAWADRLGKVKR